MFQQIISNKSIQKLLKYRMHVIDNFLRHYKLSFIFQGINNHHKLNYGVSGIDYESC